MTNEFFDLHPVSDRQRQRVVINHWLLFVELYGTLLCVANASFSNHAPSLSETLQTGSVRVALGSLVVSAASGTYQFRTHRKVHTADRLFDSEYGNIIAGDTQLEDLQKRWPLESPEATEGLE